LRIISIIVLWGETTQLRLLSYVYIIIKFKYLLRHACNAKIYGDARMFQHLKSIDQFNMRWCISCA